MKKLLLVLFCAFTTLVVSAQVKTYTDKLTITINGESVVVPNVSVLYQDNGDGTVNFTLKNFILSSGETVLPVGNIRVPNMPITKGESYDTFEFHDKILLEDGDAEALPEGFDSWMGSVLFPEGLMIDLSGKVNDQKAYVLINIDLSEVMGQIVEVKFGDEDFTPSRIYTEDLIITINDQSSAPQTTDVKVVDNGDGTIDFIMMNFFMANEETSVPVGNIVIKNMPVTKGENGVDLLTYNGPLVIQPGDMEGIDFWVGPSFGEIPLDLRGKMTEDKMYAVIDIDIREAFGQVLFVQFGTDDFPEEQDAIKSITPAGKSSDAIYDLSGRRVKTPSRGIYVVDGKKILF